MPGAEAVSITPTERQRDLIEEALRSGEYATAGEIVQDALREWQERRESQHMDAAGLRTLWDAGKASGTPQPLDFGELRAEARRSVGDPGTGRG